MEAKTLQKKKATVQKGKLKKTIKNIICRPDEVFWPKLSIEQAKILQDIMKNHKINIPEYKKPHWKELKSIPKEQRPKAPKIRKVDGLLFGISECCSSINKNECAAIIIEASVNPCAIVQSVIDASINAKVPLVCMEDLKKTCASYFGIPTSCLGIKNNCIQELSTIVQQLYKKFKQHKNTLIEKKNPLDTSPITMECNINEDQTGINKTDCDYCPYLYRSDKKSRVFIPNPSGSIVIKQGKDFIGQDFIKITDTSDKKPLERKNYMNMILKRIANNPNRLKKEKTNT